MGKDHLEDKGTGRRTIFILDLKDKEWEGTDWIHLARNKVQLAALMNTVKRFQVP
jgi:hypothetical protein